MPTIIAINARSIRNSDILENPSLSPTEQSSIVETLRLGLQLPWEFTDPQKLQYINNPQLYRDLIVVCELMCSSNIQVFSFDNKQISRESFKKAGELFTYILDILSNISEVLDFSKEPNSEKVAILFDQLIFPNLLELNLSVAEFLSKEDLYDILPRSSRLES